MTVGGPDGAMVAVSSDAPDGRRYLLLHRCDVAPDAAGDWVWGCPSGCRDRGESIHATAARELREETGIEGVPVAVVTEGVNWAVFRLAVPWGCPIRLAPDEHDDFAWLTFGDALERLLPAVQATSFVLAVNATTT